MRRSIFTEMLQSTFVRNEIANLRAKMIIRASHRDRLMIHLEHLHKSPAPRHYSHPYYPRRRRYSRLYSRYCSRELGSRKPMKVHCPATAKNFASMLPGVRTAQGRSDSTGSLHPCPVETSRGPKRGRQTNANFLM